jgi:NADH dehydrogenase
VKFVADKNSGLHKIVVVGGGAGGLELATWLGDKLGGTSADLTLIDRSRTHLWKPLLHEVAAGTMDFAVHEIDYLAQAHWHNFHYRIGEMTGLDRERKEVELAPYFDDEGHEVTGRRSFPYDTLVIAIGSESNDFNTPGVRNYATSLDTPVEAIRFHKRLVNAYIRGHSQSGPLRTEQLKVAIIGAGATGTELAAELHYTTRQLVAYGLDRIDPEKDIEINLIDAADRILPALPERISESALDLLKGLGVKVHTASKVAEVSAGGVKLTNGKFIPAELVVWAAGIKAPNVLKNLGGLESNGMNQLIVRPTLQTTRDDNIFAIGDCSACAWEGHPGRQVPPRAQAAHQQASFMVKQFKRRLANRPMRTWHYRDFGSLVSLGEYSTVGNLMGGLIGGNLWIEGLFARLMYRSLRKMHEHALHGSAKVTLDTLAHLITRRTEPHVKLH